MKNKILITGGSGFIGTNFVKLLYKNYPNTEIFNLDKFDFEISKNNHRDILAQKFLTNIKQNSKHKLSPDNRYHEINGSILDEELLDKLFREYKFDQVINFAAQSHVDNSIKSPNIFTINNVIGTQNLLNQCLKNETSLFIQISTDEVYGSLTAEDTSTNEESTLQPNNPYSASKAAADCIVRSYYQTYQLPCIITRSSNNFGPYQYPEKLIPVVISNALKNQTIPIYGDGLNIRDWVFVEDNCKAIDFIRQNGKIGEVYNIPGHSEITNIQMSTEILKILNKATSLIKYVEDRKGHDFRYSMDGRKLKKLGFEIQSNFSKNLKDTVNWYLNNPNWLSTKETSTRVNVRSK